MKAEIRLWALRLGIPILPSDVALRHVAEMYLELVGGLSN